MGAVVLLCLVLPCVADSGGTTDATRARLAAKGFNHTAAYDQAILKIRRPQKIRRS